MPYWAKTLLYRVCTCSSVLLASGCATSTDLQRHDTICRAHVALGHEYLTEDSPERARQAFEKAYPHCPDDVSVFHGLALCAHLTHAWDDAEHWYRKARHAADRTTSAYVHAQIDHNYARLLYDMKRNDEACHVWRHRHRAETRTCPYADKAARTTAGTQGFGGAANAVNTDERPHNQTHHATAMIRQGYAA